jgi:hypothetical protein
VKTSLASLISVLHCFKSNCSLTLSTNPQFCCRAHLGSSITVLVLVERYNLMIGYVFPVRRLAKWYGVFPYARTAEKIDNRCEIRTY